ncbi:MAG: hypothetical protein ACRD8U_23470 [Pyrinomonadaceae bacterium]
MRAKINKTSDFLFTGVGVVPLVRALKGYLARRALLFVILLIVALGVAAVSRTHRTRHMINGGRRRIESQKASARKNYRGDARCVRVFKR